MATSGLHYARKVTIWLIILLVAGCLLPAGQPTAQARPDKSEYSLITLQAVTDAWIAEGYPGSNCGSQATLAAGYDWTNTTRGKVRSLIKFDLSELPDGAPVSQALLYLYYVKSNGPQSGDYTIRAARVTSPWAEDSVGWGNAPTYLMDSPITTTINHASPGTWVTLDVAPIVQGWAYGEYPNYGIALLGPEEISPGSTTEIFESGDSYNPLKPAQVLHPPRMEVTYQSPAQGTRPANPPDPLINVFLPLLMKDFPPKLDLHPIDNDGGEGTYTISWTPHPNGALYYELFELTGSEWKLIFTASAIETSFLVSNKPVGVYSYYLKATATWGSEMSLVRSVTVSDSPEQFAYLIIGLGDYQNMPSNNTQVPQMGMDLKYPVFDATDIQDMLQVHGSVDDAGQALAITNRKATKVGIQESITGWLDAHEAANTTVFIYFSGHTLVQNGKPFLAPHDLACAPCANPPGSSNWLASSGISAEELNMWLGDLASNRFIFVIDSPGSEQWILELQGEGRTILAGSRSLENRWEFRDVQNGAFSYYFNQSPLKGADLNLDGMVSIDEILSFAYTSPTLASFVYQHTLDIKDGPFQQHAVSLPGIYGQDGFIKAVTVQSCQPLP